MAKEHPMGKKADNQKANACYDAFGPAWRSHSLPEDSPLPMMSCNSLATWQQPQRSNESMCPSWSLNGGEYHAQVLRMDT
eukprot:6477593-Amphidinium_carterae.2